MRSRQKTGPYHNFRTDHGSTGGHYFFPNGLWSILTSDDHQLPAQTTENVNVEPEFPSIFIDDDYEDQQELSFSDTTPDRQIIYPSIASFPDMDIGIPTQLSRDRFLSASEPELPSQSCHRSLTQRLRRWCTAVRDAWVSSESVNRQPEPEEEEEEGRAATPH